VIWPQSLPTASVGRRFAIGAENLSSMARFRTITALAAVLLLLAAAPANASTYRVRWGDTLTWIADAHHITLNRLAQVNGLDPYGVLVQGTVLRIPRSRGHVQAASGTRPASSKRHHSGHGTGWMGRYTVRWGDTLTAIAARHGSDLLQLARINNLDPYGVLLTGAVLRVPAGHGRAQRPAAQPAPQHLSASWSVRGSIDHWAAHYGVDARLARAVAWMESGYHTGAVSSVGAWGVMQVMPDTWRFVETSLIGHRVARTSDGNIRIGVAYLHHLLAEFGGSERLALAAYYEGPGALHAFGVLPVSEIYIADVLALKSRV
jgi:LysM repeat protein